MGLLADRVLSIGLPLLGILVVGLAFYAVTSPSTYQHAVMSIQVGLTIQLIARDLSHSKITPAADIGRAGGVMATTRYLKDGIGGNYPIYTLDTTGIIYVQSQVARQYTLGDFFEVWGNALGPTNTLGRPANFTSTGVVDYYWAMCLKGPQGPIPTADWGGLVLINGGVISLVYSEVGCS